MPETVVDRFEVIEVEGKHADRRLAGFAAGQQRGSGGEETAPVEERGQGIGLGRRLVAIDGAVFGQDQHDKSGADHIEHDLDRENGDPAGGEAPHAE